MPWDPDAMTANRRRAAATTVVQAQVILDRLDRNEFGPDHAEVLRWAYLRIDDMLAMLLQALYGVEEVETQLPPSS